MLSLLHVTTKQVVNTMEMVSPKPHTTRVTLSISMSTSQHITKEILDSESAKLREYQPVMRLHSSPMSALIRTS